MNTLRIAHFTDLHKTLKIYRRNCQLCRSSGWDPQTEVALVFDGSTFAVEVSERFLDRALDEVW